MGSQIEQATQNSASNHSLPSGHWKATANKSGLYEFQTGGKFVDRNIDFEVPKATLNVSGTATKTLGGKTFSIEVGNWDRDIEGYELTGAYELNESWTGVATAQTTSSNPVGFLDKNAKSSSSSTDNDIYKQTGNVNAQITGRISTSTYLDKIGLSTAGEASALINEAPTPEYDSQNKSYKFLKSEPITGTTTVDITSSGYGKAGNSITTQEAISGRATMDIALSPANVQITGNKNISVNDVTLMTDTNVKHGAVTHNSEPTTSTKYIKLVAHIPNSTSVTPTLSTNATAGYFGKNSGELNGSITISDNNNSNFFYIPITESSVTKGTTTVSGTTATRGTFNIAEGYIGETDGDLPAATFSNTATSGKSYVDISNTSAAPALVSDGYLYINQGYTDNLKISLAKLVPDSANITIDANGRNGNIRSGFTVYDKDGKLVTGSMPDSTTTGSNNSATASASASITPQIASTLYKTSETTGYTLVDTATAAASVSTVSASKTITAGYLASNTTATASVTGSSDSKSSSLYIKNAVTSGSNNSATASVNAYASTSNLVSGTYATTATTGYTYHIDSSASVSNVSATKTVAAGLLSSDTSVTASVTGSSSSKTTYLKDSSSSVELTSNAATVALGTTLTIGKGYYPYDRVYTIPDAEGAAGRTDITGTLSASIASGYIGPGLVGSPTSGIPYITFTGNGSATSGRVYSGTARAETQYMEVYTGTYSVE